MTFHQDCCTYIHHLLPGSRTQDSTWHVGKSDCPCVQFCSPRFSHSKLIHRNKLAKSKTVSFSGCLDRHMLPSRYSTTVCEDTAYLCSVLPETVSRTVWDCSTQAFLQVTKQTTPMERHIRSPKSQEIKVLEGWRSKMGFCLFSSYFFWEGSVSLVGYAARVRGRFEGLRDE